MEVVKPERFFHQRFGLSDGALERVLGTALARRAGWADLYFEFRVNQTASLEEGVVKKATRNVSQGVGVRVVAGARSGYAHSDEVSLERLELAARAAATIAEQRGAAIALPATRATAAAHDLYPVARPPIDTPTADQVALLQRLDAVARAVDPCITNVFAGIGIEHRVILVVTSAGAVVGDVRPLVHLSVTCIAERGGRREQGSYAGGGRYAFDTLLDGRAQRFAREAGPPALTHPAAPDAPAGPVTGLPRPGWPGVLLHEAIGHGLEGDFNRKCVSAFTGRVGTRVASELCTVVDDGTIADRRGSLNVDDEGTPTQRTVLIERGILRGYLQDRLNAALMRMTPTGNGRRESFAHLPMPRMTNTFMLAGEDAAGDDLRSGGRALYARDRR